MNESGLVASFRLDGEGGGLAMDWADIERWTPADGVLWVHLNRASDDAQQWLHERSGLSEVVVEALLAENTRPRCVQMDDGVMLFLRGINHNPGADPEDMVSIRMWIQRERVITVRMRRLMSVDDLRQALDERNGPRTVGELVAQLSGNLVARMAAVIVHIDDEIDGMQELVLDAGDVQLRNDLRDVRRRIIALRRYLAPQRDALNRLTQIKTNWLDELDVMHLREEADRVTRYAEDLDAARERAAVTQEELGNRLSDQLNRRMYVLSVVAAVFLPLGFLTGLFGINVGGIPLSDNPIGFGIIVGVLILVTLLQVVIFRWRKWF